MTLHRAERAGQNAVGQIGIGQFMQENVLLGFGQLCLGMTLNGQHRSCILPGLRRSGRCLPWGLFGNLQFVHIKAPS